MLFCVAGLGNCLALAAVMRRSWGALAILAMPGVLASRAAIASLDVGRSLTRGRSLQPPNRKWIAAAPRLLRAKIAAIVVGRFGGVSRFTGLVGKIRKLASSSSVCHAEMMKEWRGTTTATRCGVLERASLVGRVAPSLPLENEMESCMCCDVVPMLYWPVACGR